MNDKAPDGITERNREVLDAIRSLNRRSGGRATADRIARYVGGEITNHTVKSHIRKLRQARYSVEYDRETGEYVADHPDGYDAGTSDEHGPETIDAEPDPAGDPWRANGVGQEPYLGRPDGCEHPEDCTHPDCSCMPEGCTYPDCSCTPGNCRAEGEADDGEAEGSGPPDVDADADLNRRESYILDRLPASADELADDLEVEPPAIRAHIDAARAKGFAVRYDADNSAFYLPNSEAKRKIGSENMGQITREANNWLDAAEDRQLRLLRGIDPVTANQSPTEHGEDIVAVLSDVHVGQNVETETGQTIYAEDEWREAYRLFGEKCISIPERMVAPHIQFDTFHLVLNGDHVTNENIYPHQIEDVGAYLADQIDICVDELLPVIFGVADRYPTVNVVCQVGNHGELRADGQTRDANADLLVYRELKRHISRSEYDNINFNVGSATAYTTFDTRGGEWRSLASHGEAAYEQITGTSASDSQMENWLVGHEPSIDTFYLAHYHEYRRAPVDGIPAIRTPSPKPGGPHEFEIGALQASHAVPKLGYIHGVSDTRPITWESVMDYASTSDPDHATDRARGRMQ